VGSPFVVAFGARDITFHLFLKILLGWPPSLLTWDILFIVPVLWVAPVIAAVLVSTAMLAAGAWHLRREVTVNPVRLGIRNWAGLVTGAGVIITSFTLDHANISAGGMPRPFQWLVFGTGMSIALVGYGEAALKRRPRKQAVTA
jgi:hypothetical protein